VNNLETLLREPRYMPHRVDIQGDRLLFVDTTRARLTAASFLDGRTPLTDAPMVTVSLASALTVKPAIGGTDRIIGHVSFCGSTLLARLCDVPGHAFAYKEPQALVDITDAWVAARLRGCQDPRIGPTLDLVLAQLRLPWTAGEVTVIKPSNWVNALLPLMAERSSDMRFALIDMAPRDFLIAVFRGGRDRIVHTLRIASHMQVAHPELSQVIAAASSSTDPLLDAARLCVVALCLQRSAFDGVDPDRRARLAFRSVVADPAVALSRANDLLGLAVPATDRAASVIASGALHAKGPDRTFDPMQRSAEDERIEALHRPRIDAALAWAASTLPGHLVGLDGLL
jgi:hypothetical protein